MKMIKPHGVYDWSFIFSSAQFETKFIIEMAELNQKKISLTFPSPFGLSHRNLTKLPV